MTDCKHNHLNRLEGPLHPAPNDYVCPDCGQQFKAEATPITVTMGLPGATGAAKEKLPKQS